MLSYQYAPITAQLQRVSFGFNSVDYSYYPCDGDPQCGKLETVLSPYDGISTHYAYNNFLVSSTTTQTPGNSTTLSYSYDDRFRRTTTQLDAEAAPETLAFDNDNLITCLSAGDCTSGNARIEYTLDPALPRVDAATTYAASGDTLQEGITYNPFGQVDTYQVTGGATPFSLTYTYDEQGRIDTVSEVSSGTTHPTKKYDYDKAGRLWRVYPDASNASVYDEYTYDDNGNRDCAEGASAYDEQDRLTTCNGVTYTFDENGSLTGRGADSFQYDVLGNLLTATVNGTTVDYLIDGAGRRVGRTVNGVTTRYVYDGQLRIVAELDNAGSVVSRFYYGGGVNVPELMVSGGSTYRFVTDHLGSPRQVVDVETGSVVFAASYDAWGNRTVTAGSEDFVPFGFAGGLYDVDTGLVRFGARDYEPITGRWTSKDPILFGGGINLYRYADNQPSAYTDPEGEWIWFVIGAALWLTADSYIKDPVERASAAGQAELGLACMAMGEAFASRGGNPKLSSQIDDAASPATPVGRRGQKAQFPNPNEPRPRNAPGTVGGREYSGHAFDRMQERGYTPTVVENAITTGRAVPGNTPGTTQVIDDINDFSVIINSQNGRVISVY